ncbi:MAG: histidine kinase [bacterium]|nr:MAG: histidine kinase [bacterium]
MITSKIVDRIDDLPTLPASFNEICRVADEPRSSSREIAAVLERDMVITAKVLRLINSAFYGMTRKISKVEQAITLLGVSAVKNLIMATSVFKVFGGQEDIKGLWVHSISVAVTAKIIGQNLHYREIEELFICGLMHDIGKVVEYKFHSEEVKAVRGKCLSEELFYWQAEKELFETTHERIGQLLLSRWKVPDRYCKVVGLHHRPRLNSEYAMETVTVFLADALVRSLKLGDSWDGNLVPEIDTWLTEYVNMKVLDNEEIIELVHTQTDAILKIFFNDME